MALAARSSAAVLAALVGLAGMVVTIEPGIYFIDMLLDELKAKGLEGSVDWNAVEHFKPYGGIRIEDDVACTNDAPINLTREVWKEIA